MEADSLAQSVEMSAVPWPLLKLCFPLISALWEMMLLSKNCLKGPRLMVLGENHFGGEMSGPGSQFVSDHHAVVFVSSDLDT